jgi:SAM-dependent methyltransferase
MVMMIEKKEKIREFWARYPMTYAIEHGNSVFIDQDGKEIEVTLGTPEFFEIADKIFYRWNQAEHNEIGYFGKLFDYKQYIGKPVLEVGCGLGCMAMNWAKHDAKITAVDLNPVAIEQTRHRFSIYGLDGLIREADAENLPFPDGSFDFAYSWGVLHHTPNTSKAIHELYRVLKPGGRVGVMLYHRDSIMFRYLMKHIDGFIHMDSLFLTPLEFASRYGDGERKEGNPHTWPVTKKEVRNQLFTDFNQIKIHLLGTEIEDILNKWFPGLGSWMPDFMMNACIRRWGWSLWITAQKAE